MENSKVTQIFSHLKTLFGDAPKCELNYKTDVDLLVAIILSAQCTDVRVNKVTATLFKKYRTAQDYANANLADFQNEIRSTGFYRNKAKNIITCFQQIIADHKGRIPTDMKALTRLPGVGRKTASVFLAEFHKIPAMAVDTHVMRTARRLGMTTSKNPVVIERDLCALFDRGNWGSYHLYLVLFGRYHCKAQKPKCDICELCNLCSERNFR